LCRWGFTELSDSSGRPDLKITVTVPLDGSKNLYYQGIPRDPRARVVVSSPDGKVLIDTRC